MLSSPSKTHSVDPSKAAPSVLFLTAERRPMEGSRLYRCANQAKQLRNAGLGAEVALLEEVTPTQLARADVLVFARCRLDKRTLELVRAGRAQQKALCGDLDDRVFVPWDVRSSGFVRSAIVTSSGSDSEEQAIAVAERARLRLLSLLELVLVSTLELKQEVESLGIPASLSRNALDLDLVKPMCRERTSLRRLIVMSGTRTHDADLELIARPLARFLVENPEIHCTLLGPFAVPGPLRGLGNVETKNVLPPTELYPFLANYDLCLVPLEDTRFNACKSALKFLECGAVSLPVLASSRADYRALIRDGETGFLVADDAEAWYRALTRLRDAPAELARVSRAAYQAVVTQHAIASRATELADVMRSLAGRLDARDSR